jgi:citronellol/citronellal dehydrogenase
MPSQVFRDGVLDGQVAIVTGGGSGIGRVTALELASLGADVVVAGRRPEPLVQTAGLQSDGPVRAHTCDVRGRSGASPGR